MDKEPRIYICPICQAVLDSDHKGWVFAMRGHRAKHQKAEPGLTNEETAWVRL